MTWERLENRSLTIAEAIDLPNDDGLPVLVVVSKLSFRFDPTAPEQRALRLAARPIRRFESADPAGGVRYPRDFSLPFPGTECALVGTAHPSRVPAESKLLTMQVGTVKKAVRLFGPRVYMKSPAGVRPGPAANVVSTPLRFDHCYGGYEPGEPQHRVAENPIGRGFAVDPDKLVGVEAHRLEPAHPIGLHAAAGCFAPIDFAWAPRRDLAGTYDDAWRRTRAPAAPRDQDARYHSAVRPEQRSATHLTLPLGIVLLGFGGDDEIHLEIPAYGIDVVTEIRGGTGDSYPAPLSRVVVDLDERVIELGFIAHVPLPMKWEKLRSVRILANGSLPENVQPPRTSSVVAP
ncbi:MAG: DUF2169 domain-containing protein [Polyangiaceae bacterium]